jgi:NAD(P)-dependent dehydrogenase (short-subunit alcohol dehydrogenase family)
MLKDKVLIVTGGSSGMGQAASIMFAADGAKVLVVDRSEKGTATAGEIVRAGGIAIFQQADISDEGAVERMVATAISEFGRLDGAFNNAGVAPLLKLLPELDSSEYDRVMGINERGVFLCMKYQIMAMRKTGGGAIVNNSSTAAEMALPRGAEYVSSKHAVMGLTRAAAAEARYTGVRVNAVLPGMILTPMVEELMKSADFIGKSAEESQKERHSIGRFGQPEDVAYAARWLLSDESTYINGVGLPVDGGFLAR